MRLYKATRSACLIFFISLLLPISGWAYGNVGYSGKQCQLSIGPYTANFTGYQPSNPRGRFCDDVPKAGKTFITLDFSDNSMRNLPVDYRIIRDVNNSGVTATLQDLGTPEDIEAATVHYIEPKSYPAGTINIELNLEEGHYIGIVNIKDANAANPHTAVFPFSVGFGEAVRYGTMGIKGFIQALFMFIILAVIVMFYKMANS